MAVPYTFGSATSAIPLSQLDSNFATTITLGNTAVQLGNTVTTLNNMTLANVAISSGSVTITDVTASGNVTISAGTANGVAYLNGSKVLTTGSALVFDGSNLGLGVTPSAWGSGFTSFDLGQNSRISGSSSMGIGNNIYYNGTNYIYKNTAAASLFSISNSGVYSWSSAASGTAGATATFTQAMTLDASGRLAIGATSVTNGTAFGGGGQVNVAKIESAGYPCFQINTNSGGGTSVQFTNSGTVNGVIGYNASGGTNEFNVNNALSGALTFATNNTERARIDSSGNLLVGTTSSPGARFVVEKSNLVADFVNTFGTPSSSETIRGINNVGTVTFKVLGNGNVQNTNNSYGAISDSKLKENITDATPKLEKLNQIRVVNYNLIGEEQKQIGVIAQELEQVFPSMIEETPDRDMEGNDLGTTTKSVKYSVFVPMLIKAIQEQQAIITSLTARIEALEA